MVVERGGVQTVLVNAARTVSHHACRRHGNRVNRASKSRPQHGAAVNAERRGSEIMVVASARVSWREVNRWQRRDRACCVQNVGARCACGTARTRQACAVQ